MTSNSSRLFRTVSFTAPAAALLVVGLAAPANAAVTVGGSSVNGDAANDSIIVRCLGGVLSADGTATTGDACASILQVFVYPNGGSDTVDLSAVTAAAFPAMISTYVNSDDAEADSVQGSATPDVMIADTKDTLAGNAGNDHLTGGASVSGGLGDDTVIEFNGTGVVSGGPGDDRFVQFIPTGGLEGGTGFDVWDVDYDRVAPRAGADLHITLTHDQVRVVLSGFLDSTVPVSGLEQAYWTLLRGDVQSFDGAAFSGVLNIRGMDGVDTITGGAADDALYGGGGNDTVTGNSGVDVLNGGEGDDTINARDGVADRVDCGAGVDTVVADAVDVVANCESVQLPAVAAPPVAPPVAVVPVTGAISGSKAVTKPAKAKFTFSSATAGATFQCKVDAKAWKACTSPYKVATKKLEPGKHKLLVRAVVGGAMDATPSTKVFRVRRG